jgi:LppP/LprE lipoprotein
MESTARRVKAERDRQRLPHRSGAERWTLRIVFVLATAAFLGVGVASALMILPDDNNQGAAAVITPIPTTAKKAAAKHAKSKSSKPKGPTKLQRAQRTAAVAELRRQGFTALKLSDYDYKATLRVLIGRPVGDAAGGSYAFFFLKDRYLGKDSTTPSNKLSVAKTGKSQVTLTYETSAGRTKVRFKLEGETLQPLDEIPPPGDRFVKRVT